MADSLVPNINPLPPAPMPPDTPAPAAPQTTADRARLRLNAIINDKEMSAKYRSGDIATVQEVRSLNMVISEQPSADRLGEVIAGTAAPGRVENTDDSNPLTTSELMGAVAGLREQGHMDHIIKEILTGEPGVSEERHNEALRLRTRVLADREWLQKYRAGSGEHRQMMHRLNAVIAAKIKVGE
jgi:hypothetical protein